MADTEIGYYTLPVILSFDGIEKNVNSRLGKAFGDVGKKSSKAFADSTEVDLKRATDAYGKLRDRAADALGKVRVEEEKLKKARDGGKADQIAAAEERLSKARRDSTRINREAIASYSDLEAAQKRLTDSTGGLLSKLKNVGGAASSSGGQAAAGFVDGFGGPIAALGTKAGPVGIALAATVGLGLLAGKALGEQILAGMDQLQGQANVAAKLGLTPEQINPIAKAAADAYAQNFGDSIEGNLDAARAAIQGGLIDPDASQADIAKIVAQLDTVAAVTGESIPNAVRTAQQAVRTGLAQDVTGAFDLIVKAQQSGLNVSEDLFDTLNEYGTQFRKLGLDGPEALGLIAQAVKGGARDTDTAADALKEFSIRSIDGSKLTGQAYRDLGLSFKGTTEAFAAGGDTAKATFQEVVNRIAAVEDPAKRAQIQVALFGTKAEDLGDAVNAMNLDTAVSQLGEVEGATERATDTLGGTGASSIESARRNIEVAVDTMQQGLANAFGPALKRVADWVVANQDKIVDFFVGVGHAAITASEFVIDAAGQIVEGLGQLLAPLGDAYGLLLQFKALNADWTGDDDEAAQLRKDAEAAFGFGEGLTAAGKAMRDFDDSSLHKSLDDTASKAADATTATSGLTSSLDQLRKQQFFEAFGKPMPGVSGAAPGSIGVRGDVAGLNLSTVEVSAQQFANNCISASARIILSATDKVLSEVDIDQVIARGGSIDSLAAGLNKLNPAGKYFPLAGSGGSPEAMFAAIKESIDKGIGSVLNVAPGSSLGGTTFDYGHFIAVTGYDPKTGQINLSDTADGSVYSVSPAEAFQASRGRGIVAGTGTGGRAASPTTSKPVPVTIANPSGTPLPAIPSSVAAAMPTVTAAMPSLDTSRLFADPTLNNAYGPGYEPGIGTPGRDEYGEAGYFRVDPRALREAQQRADDAAYAITEADAAAEAARQARAELNDTPNVDASQIAGADEAVRDAERRAALARREAADAATDAAEVAKGEFTKAKEVAKTKDPKTAAAGKDSPLGALGSIASSFLEETFGFGSLLPALDSFAPLQMADTLIGAFDWSTMGMSPEAQAAKAAAQGTSSDAFGIPNIAAPPMPQGGAHGGSGAAPGPTIVNVDQSQNFSNSPLGWDPAQVNKQRENNINRAPRLPIGMGN